MVGIVVPSSLFHVKRFRRIVPNNGLHAGTSSIQAHAGVKATPIPSGVPIVLADRCKPLGFRADFIGTILHGLADHVATE